MKVTRISYRELADRLDDWILCNNIWQADEELSDNPFNGETTYCAVHDGQDECRKHPDTCEFEEAELYQSFLIGESDAEFLKRHTDEVIYYSPLLDLYVWGVQHYGTSWSGVSLDFREDIDDDNSSND